MVRKCFFECVNRKNGLIKIASAYRGLDVFSYSMLLILSSNLNLARWPDPTRSIPRHASDMLRQPPFDALCRSFLRVGGSAPPVFAQRVRKSEHLKIEARKGETPPPVFL